MAGPRVEITGATPADGDGRGRLEVAYTVLARRATDVVELEVEVEHDAGVLTGRLAPPPLVGGAGRGTADIDARALPAGRAIVRITPVGRRGGRGDPGVLPVAVPATGADPGLRIVAWEALDPAVAAPGARSVATPRLHLVWEGAGEAAAHITVERPGGRTGYAVVTAPPGGTGTVAPLRLDDRAPAGEYRVTARLVGAGGAMSDPATATVRVGERGVATPRVERTRWRGAHGDLVVRGGGFDGPDLAVLIDGAPVPVATVGPDELVVHAAGLVDDATLEVRTAHGSGTARARVRPRVALRIEPEDPVATEGEAIRLQAVVTGTRDGAVAWSLEDAAAGVTLGEDGTLTAGVDAPETVTVRAASAIDPKVTATATVRILPPSGPAAEIGARGGRVASPDGRAVLSVAPGALDTPAAVEVRPRRARPAGRGEIVAAEVAMTGAALAGEATLEVALETHAAPGSKLTSSRRSAAAGSRSARRSSAPRA